jgi:hypothetical protein
MTPHQRMSGDEIVEWMIKNPNKSIYVMVRVNFETSIPCKITMQECIRFCRNVEIAQTKINEYGHLIVGL